MRICVLKTTNEVLEMQTDAREGTLTQNAILAGYALEEVEERVVTETEYQALIDAQPKPLQPPTVEERLEAVETALLMII